ncbi:response regulator [candidate division KSB1 bacterium]|nr:response regulator [candidate division KSB1 bacterium]
MLNVLVVHHEKEICQSTANKISEIGHTVQIAGSPSEALIACEKQTFEFVLLNDRWPEMNSIQLIKQFQSLYPYIHVVIMTEKPSVENAVAAVRQGAFDYLTFPVAKHRMAALFEKAYRIKPPSSPGKQSPADKMTIQDASSDLKEPQTTATHEIYHRFKNTLQIISSLLDLGSLRIDDGKAIELFTDTRDKVQTISLVYTQLYKSHHSDRVEISNLLKQVYDYLSSVHCQDKSIENILLSKEIFLPVQVVIPFLLAVHEMIANCFKHAFKDRRDGRIIIEFFKKNNNVHLMIKDNGVGIPADYNVFDSKNLGLKLAKNLIEKQLKGSIHLDRTGGTNFIVGFPI